MLNLESAVQTDWAIFAKAKSSQSLRMALPPNSLANGCQNGLNITTIPIRCRKSIHLYYKIASWCSGNINNKSHAWRIMLRRLLGNASCSFRVFRTDIDAIICHVLGASHHFPFNHHQAVFGFNRLQRANDDGDVASIANKHLRHRQPGDSIAIEHRPAKGLRASIRTNEAIFQFTSSFVFDQLVGCADDPLWIQHDALWDPWGIL